MMDQIVIVGGYRANAVTFDGTNDYIEKTTALTGIADSETFTFSAWVKMNDGDDDQGVPYNIFEITTGIVSRLIITKYDTASVANHLLIQGSISTGTVILNIRSAAESLRVSSGWVHILVSIDMSDTGKRHLYLNDVSDLSVVTYANDTIDFDVAISRVGLNVAGDKLPADMSDLWFDTSYIDLSVEANRRKFITAAGKPAFLGFDGSRPTGAAPLVFLSGATADWHTNKGSGGGFTENGALTDAATSPSD